MHSLLTIYVVLLYMRFVLDFTHIKAKKFHLQLLAITKQLLCKWQCPIDGHVISTCQLPAPCEMFYSLLIWQRSFISCEMKTFLIRLMIEWALNLNKLFFVLCSATNSIGSFWTQILFKISNFNVSTKKCPNTLLNSTYIDLKPIQQTFENNEHVLSLTNAYLFLKMWLHSLYKALKG